MTRTGRRGDRSRLGVARPSRPGRPIPARAEARPVPATAVIASHSGQSESPSTVLKSQLEELGESAFAESHVLGHVPWLFAGDATSFDAWRAYVACEGKVAAESVFIVGSASTGVSLNPTKAGRPFRRIGGQDAPSDIDAALVDHELFTMVWNDVVSLDRSQALAGPFNRTFGKARDFQELRAEVRLKVYWGAIADRLASPATPAAARLRAISAAATRSSPLTGYRLGFRLYRRYEDLRQAQIVSLRSLRTALSGGSP